MCYEFLKEKQNHNFKNTADEIQYFLDKVAYYLPKDYTYIEKKQKKAGSFLSVFQTKVHRDDYIKIFDHVFELYGLPQRTKVSNV
jgi:hypothetical protein